jgi:hypothetical protein
MRINDVEFKRKKGKIEVDKVEDGVKDSSQTKKEKETKKKERERERERGRGRVEFRKRKKDGKAMSK